MRIFWTLFKVILGLAIAIPAGIILLGLTAGVVGLLFGLAIITLKLACVALIGYGLFRIVRLPFGSASKPAPRPAELPPADPYYVAAMRELDEEMGGRRR